MTEDINPEVIKKTQDTLGKYIKKPVLTEKLLRKPPFRFLHDICTSAMRETGFFEGTLSAVEVKADNIKDKEGKIAFLQKVIAAVESSSGIKLTVKPNKVVAGHEPAKTNEFLQALGKALERQLENGNGTKPIQSKSNKGKTSKNTFKEETNKTKSKIATNKQGKTIKPVENGIGTSIPKGTKTKKKNEKKIEELATEAVTDGGSNFLEAVAANEHEEEVQGQPLVNGNIHHADEDEKPQIQHRTSARRRSSHRRGEAGHNGEKTGAEEDEREGEDEEQGRSKQLKEELLEGRILKNEDTDDGRRPQSARPGHRKPSARTSVGKSTPIEGAAHSEVTRSNVTVEQTERVLGERVEASPSPPVLAPSLTTKEPVPSKDGIITRPRTAIRPTTSRPASARPAAPRIRDRGEVALQEEVIRPVAGKVNLIVETDVSNDPDEDINVVSVETTQDILAEEDQIVSPVSLDTPLEPVQGEHGHLVQQILEAEKELGGDSNSQHKTEIEWQSGRNRESTQGEVERLRTSIQTLTRSANPLGKLVDFLQEDVDTMHRELDNWKDMNATLAVKITQEESITEQSIEPLHVYLKELQHSIDQQLEQMNLVRANIVRNDSKIQRLLTGF